MGTIVDLDELTTPAVDDWLLVRDVSDVTNKDKKMAVGKVALTGAPNVLTQNNAINSVGTTGSALSVTRDLAAASTNAPVVRVVQDNAGDDQGALYVQQDGAGPLLQLYNGATPRVTVQPWGGVGIGTTLPQSTFHVYNGQGGHLFFAVVGLTGTPQVIIPDGVGDVTMACRIEGAGRNTQNGSIHFSVFVLNNGAGGTGDVTLGAEIMRFTVAANGQLSVAVVSGTAIWQFTAHVIWQ